MTTPPVEIVRAGRTSYADGTALQADLHRTVAGSGGRKAFLVLTEHEPVFTLGRHAREGHMRADPALLAARGIPVVRTDRGGQVTYHGPGQLIGYPILPLRSFRLTVRRFVCAIERALIALLAAHGVSGRRREGSAGVWTGPRKIASIGLRIDRGISRHGFALNVSTDLEPFSWIDPCGERGQAITSLGLETGRTLPLAAAGDEFARRFVDILAGAPAECRR